MPFFLGDFHAKKSLFLLLILNFRFNEDCNFSCCNYREHQTHFHCMRKDCNYRFCDKTRFVQHTARHERLDTLCGNEFEGFRGVTCGRQNCELNALHARRKSILLSSDILGTWNPRFWLSGLGCMGLRQIDPGFSSLFIKLLPYLISFHSWAHWRCCETLKIHQFWQKWRKNFV